MVRRPHAGNGQRRSLRVDRGSLSVFFLRSHWAVPWRVLYTARCRKGLAAHAAPGEWEFTDMAQRPMARQDCDRDAKAAEKGRLLDAFPHVMSQLIDLRYDGGDQVRQPGTLYLRAAGGLWLGILKDPSSGLQLRVQGPTVEDMLTALELLLSCSDAPWEHDPYAKQPATKKKK